MNFCSPKCRKNYELGRDRKKVKWVRKFKKKATNPETSAEVSEGAKKKE